MGHQPAIAEGGGIAIYDQHAPARPLLGDHLVRTTGPVGVVTEGMTLVAAARSRWGAGTVGLR